MSQYEIGNRQPDMKH
ncbi:hypothetical protein MOC52_21450 [Bacillus inaquosorum]|nr:hypothetical protein [Bacillus inaquosorum]MCY8165058.1 hypothetical protein [Bacillus inaquosorum]